MLALNNSITQSTPARRTALKQKNQGVEPVE
jgi:hypothetical protein